MMMNSTIRSRCSSLLLAIALPATVDGDEAVLLWPDDPALNSPDKMGVSRESGGKTRITDQVRLTVYAFQ